MDNTKKQEEYVRGSFTVEGSFIFGISMLIIGITLGWGFHFYRSSRAYIETVKVEEMNAVKRFRLIQTGKEIVAP